MDTQERNLIEIKYSTNIIDEDSSGKTKIIKRNIVRKKVIDTYNILSYSEALNTKGKILKNKCKIFIAGEGELLVNHTYTSIHKLVQNKPKSSLIGFKLKNDNR